MLRWYLSRTPHFYSDWLWPYCDLLYFKNFDQYTRQIFTTEFLSRCCPTFFFYFKVPNVRMYLLNPFLKLVRWKKCRRMPWQKFLFFYIYLFLFCRVPLAEILVICGFLMIYLIEELAHVLLHKVRSAEKSKDECSVACTGMKSSINSISRYKWSSTYAISTVAQFLPSYAIFPSFFPSYSISPKVIWIVQFVFHTNWKQNKFLFSCLMIALMAWNNL